ncbi:MAG: hypothetical protein DI586_03505 [Micavibrio aeruginosavorus]|uniref:Glucokinase n=1 Tax=Micavibrio aeruginosavorus TaxID=349221 RepID=A0A2W5FRM8_9BACT|nr:MAG: hypothetical protein DI586_03505 [Micavibrio aeruginosavorus]
MSILLCDVGGTHIRFAFKGEGQLRPYKTRVDQHPTLNHAIEAYLSSQSVPPQSIRKFYFAFSNRNEWNTNPAELKTVLPNAVIHQINDFEANAHGLLLADQADVDLLNRPEINTIEKASKVIIGVGTGLGFAYLFKSENGDFVQRSHGAHMLPAYSAVHAELYDHISRSKEDALIYEDMLTGRGIYEIYRFLSMKSHLDIEYPDTEILMRDGKDNPVFRQALVIFHEMLGLFTHQAVAFGYSYGGVYLTGGVIDRLILAGLFDLKKFLEYFYQDLHPIVTRDVVSTPVYWIKDEFISLKGLLYLAEKENA